MTYTREPVLQPVTIESLRPTQITIGMREVEEKRKRLRKQKPRKLGEFIGHHMIPVVLGPKKRHYVIDHHHLSRALLDEGQDEVLTSVVAKLEALDHDAFWVVLGTLSVLRTNASGTGATALRALAGTVLGFAVGAALLSKYVPGMQATAEVTGASVGQAEAEHAAKTALSTAGVSR